jgi:hypothetical protein
MRTRIILLALSLSALTGALCPTAAQADATGCSVGVGTSDLWATFGPGNWPSGCWRPFADMSPYNQSLPDPSVTPLDPNSTNIVSFLNEAYGSSGFSDMRVSNVPSEDEPSKWGSPVYWAHAGDPQYVIDDTEYPCSPPNSESSCPTTVLIPDGAQHSLRSDGHLAVVEPDGTEDDFWQVQNANPISGGGVLTVHAYGAVPIDGSGCCGGATAALQGLYAGMIRPQELAAGVINHALVMSVKCSSGTHVYPAMGNGASCADTENAPAIGQRLQLNMTDAQVDAMPVADYEKVILKAMIHYGAYVTDTGGSPWDFSFEPALDYTSFGYSNPFLAYAQAAGLTTSDIYTFTFNNDVDWSKLQVVDVCYTTYLCYPRRICYLSYACCRTDWCCGSYACYAMHLRRIGGGRQGQRRMRTQPLRHAGYVVGRLRGTNALGHKVPTPARFATKSRAVSGSRGGAFRQAFTSRR